MFVLLKLSDIHCGEDGGKAQIALFKIRNRQQNLFTGLGFTHFTELSCQLSKFCSMSGVMADHVLHQSYQFSLGILGTAGTVAAAAGMAVAVVMTMFMGVGMSMDVVMSVAVVMSVVVIMSMVMIVLMGMMLMRNVVLMHVIVRMLVIFAVDMLVIVVMIVGNIVLVHIIMIVFVAHNITSFQNVGIYLRRRYSVPHKFAGYIIHQRISFVKDRLSIYTHLSPVLKHEKDVPEETPSKNYAKRFKRWSCFP